MVRGMGYRLLTHSINLGPTLAQARSALLAMPAPYTHEDETKHPRQLTKGEWERRVDNALRDMEWISVED